ncbi:EexN family lipoprotein [Thalassotalea ganghwensis]
MNLLRKTIIFTPVFLLTACGTPTVEELVKDPNLLAEVIEECQEEMMQDELSEKCKNAQKAMGKVGVNLLKNMLGN